MVLTELFIGDIRLFARKIGRFQNFFAQPFAAVCLDGGISPASALIHRVLLDTEREEVAEEKRRDYKTILQEFVQRTPNQTLSYRLFGESGPDHDKTFYFEVLLNGGAVGKGAGRSKKEAEQMAAKDALEKLTDQR